LPCTKGVFELTPAKSKSQWEYNVFSEGVPADQIVEKLEVSFSFKADDIRQGQLGNCYFVSALASLAPHPELLKARIPGFKDYDGKSKTFKVNLFESGKNIEILVDNLFAKVYVKPVLNDISPLILEKAYAQSYGNYDVLHVGHANDALRDLTGAPALYLDLKDKAQLRDRIKSAFLSRYALVIASKPQVEHPSLSPKHSYNILNYEVIGGQLFLLLRDPRGHAQTNFPMPPQLASIPEMGIFWVDEQHLDQNFEVISVCKVRHNYSYFYRSFDRKELTNNRGGLLLTASKPTKIYATIHQKHKKFFDQTFSYDIIRILVAEVSTNGGSFQVVKTLETDFNAKQACCI
jgi:calpain-15